MTTLALPKPGRRRMPAGVYWAVTILLAFDFGFGGLSSLLGVPAAKEVFSRLGYPGYFERYLALWELLGVAALLIPGPRRLREWAYAGLAFDAISAVYSLHAIGSPLVQLLPALITLGLLLASYAGWQQREPGREA
ncbi:MAG TPA: DoxX family protein [Opitutaceae bacterium]|nr:DoxX family protein [Opitutaceae bacterium]